MNIIKLNKGSYQSPFAQVVTDKYEYLPFEDLKISGNGFTAFKRRGNPAVAILIDGKPLTGAKVNDKGRFSVQLKMPPFTPGKHEIDVYGVKKEIFVKESGTVLTQEQLRNIIERDFIVDPDCHMLLSDEKYRVCPIDILKCYLGKTDVPYKKYVAEWFDCDDFSDALHGQFTFDTYPQGYAHGELWVDTGGSGHAVNCFCIQDKDTIKMVVVEPQTGSIFEFPSSWKAFMIKI